MPYPMWNPDKTGILVDRGNGVLAFLESGAEFQSLKSTAANWHVAEASKPPLPPREEQEQSRLTAYRDEADPLFFKWQAGEATEQEWLDARNAVRERYPYPE